MSAGVAGFGLSLICAAITMPANALVAPNGSFSFSLSPGNTVYTTNIARTTTSLTLGNVAPFPAITSLIDPFLGNPNNFCLTAGGGCTAGHPPGFLGTGSDVFFHNGSLLVGNIAPLPFALKVDASTRFGVGAPLGTETVDFDFTRVFTSALTPTAANSFGSLTLGFLGTFASDNPNSYLLGQAADG